MRQLEPAASHSRRRFAASLLMAAVVVVSACTTGGSSSAAPSAAQPSATAAGASASAAQPSAADAPTRGNGKKQLAFTIGLSELPIIQFLNRRMTKVAGEQGWEVLYDNATGGNIQQMLPSIEAWITAGVPAITVLPFEPAAFEPLAKRAVEKGLIWLSYVVPNDTSYGTIGIQPCKSAELLADEVVEYIKANDPQGKVFISSNIANPSVACKWEGVGKTIEDETDATVLPFQDANNEPDGLKVMTSMLQANPDVTIAIGTNDDVARGIAAAFKAAGKNPADIFVGGFDLAEPNLREIKAGDGFIKLSVGTSVTDTADMVVQKAIELAMSDATEPPADPPPFDVQVFAVQNGDPKLDELIKQYDDGK